MSSVTILIKSVLQIGPQKVDQRMLQAALLTVNYLWQNAGNWFFRTLAG